MPGLYLLLLGVSLAGLATLDWRYRLAWWAQPRRTALTLLFGVALFLVWDLLGIGLGVFFIGKNQLLTGVLLANELPLEEPVFLLLLCYTALLTYLGGGRLRRRP